MPDKLFLRHHTWTHVIHEMTPASHAACFFESFLNFCDMSLIEPHSHVDASTKVPS